LVTQLLTTGPDDAEITVALAHGAGAGGDSPFMTAFAVGLAVCGIRVIRFDFPYMEKQRQTGRRRPPDREPVLREVWQTVVESITAKRLLIGGKSLGGRIASLIVDSSGADGLVCLGYPFHPPRRPERLRTEHLKDLKTPALICQGSRDPFGNTEEVSRYALSDTIRLHWLADGDHSFKPRRASGRSQDQNWAEAMRAVADFAHGLAH
jgi:predicted alpha/beta-hydrolase family hydrolase